MKIFCLIFLFLFNVGFLYADENLNNVIDTITGVKTIGNTEKSRFVDTIKVNLLNKTTGKTITLVSKIGSTINFERIEILPLKCWKSYPEEAPENKLLLKVYENDIINNTKKMIFFGWIFSSSPSISGLEHSLYDITLIDCFNEQI